MREKCYSCMRPMSSCMCQYIHPLKTNIHFVILIHPMEYKREKNGTGLFTHLQLENSTLIVGVNFNENKQVNRILDDPAIESFILYPGSDSLNLSKNEVTLPNSDKKKVIFIIDGTWPCAKKMLRLSTNLHGIPKISFQNELKSNFHLKQQPNPACLSTIESTKVLLELLNSKNLESAQLDKFLLPFEKMVEYQIECIENPPSQTYRVNGQGRVSKKNHYKNPKGRNLFFEESEYKKHKLLEII